MSKNKKVQLGHKRYTKAIKRKNKSRQTKVLPPNSLALLLKKAKYAAENGLKPVDTDVTRDVMHVKQSKKHLQDVYGYFNYLVFTKSLVDAEVIKGIGWNINLIEMGKQILNLNHRLKILPLLDEDEIYATELFSIAGDLQELAFNVLDNVNKTATFQNIIYQVIIQCGDALPPKEDGGERTHDQIVNDVLKITGENFFHSNFKKDETVLETV